MKVNKLTPPSNVGAISVIKKAGLRPTRQRIALAKLLFDSHDRHVTAEELHIQARAAGVSISLATVYNALHQFTQAGLMREVVVEAGRSYFDTNTNAHHHFYHLETGVLTDIPVDRICLSKSPELPAGTALDSVDVTVRIIDKAG
ncbi:MAG: Fur family transcriptional regulator [Pseudomonadota bacterium]|nr:Fur family transcriptional regulator [Pseudomonadota bacterium]